MMRLPDKAALDKLQAEIKARNPVRKHVCLQTEPVHLIEPLKDRGISLKTGKAPPKPSQKPLGRPRSADPRSRKRPDYTAEKYVLNAILEYLALHPGVAWFCRMNSGAFKYQNRYVRFGSKGLSDIIGQMKDGRFFALEVKSSTGKPTLEQENFVFKVKRYNGLAGIVNSVDAAKEVLREVPV